MQSYSLQLCCGMKRGVFKCLDAMNLSLECFVQCRHLLCSMDIGLIMRTIGVGDGLWFKADDDIEELANAHQDVAADDELISHLNAPARPHLHQQLAPLEKQFCIWHPYIDIAGFGRTQTLLTVDRYSVHQCPAHEVQRGLKPKLQASKPQSRTAFKRQTTACALMYTLICPLNYSKQLIAAPGTHSGRACPRC